MSAQVVEAQLPEDPFALDPQKGTIVCAFGVKGSGKSVYCRRQWNAWPADAIGIDCTGDLDPGKDTTWLPRDLPARLPIEHPLVGTREPRKFAYRADPGSPTYHADLDRAVGLALYPSDIPTLLWIDEIGEVSQGKRTRGNVRRVLMMSRHYGPVSALLAGPRPADIEPLCYLQADGIAEYRLPRIDDREKMADLMGFANVAEHDELVRANRAQHGPHSFLYYHAPSGTVLACPALPYP